MHLPIYLDHNATTPCDPAVVEAMLPFFSKNFGNAASHQHAFGWQAEEAVKYAREQVAALIGAETQEIVFTSGATESCNLAIKGIFEAYASKGHHIITVETEHRAVLDSCKHLEKMGADVSYLKVGSNGLIDPHDIETAIKPATILIAMMYANNETGLIMPVTEIGRIAKKHGVIFFSDATQAAGKIPVNVQEDGIDLMAMSAHKMYGPKGVGALYIRRRNPRATVRAQMDGGGHERGIRSGTLNVPGVVGFGKAVELCMANMTDDSQRLRRLRDLLEASLLKIEGTHVNGDTEKRLPDVTNISFEQLEGDSLLMAINKDIALSSGAACSSAVPEPSHVLRAMGITDELAHSSLRFGLGRSTTEEEINYVIQKIKETVNALRELSPLRKL